MFHGELTTAVATWAVGKAYGTRLSDTSVDQADAHCLSGLLLDEIASNRIGYLSLDVVVGGETDVEKEPPDERCTRPTSG
jgi:hypothetical protein